MSKLIPLTRGYEAIVDDADFDWLMQWKWYAVPARGGNIYAAHVVKDHKNNTTIGTFMHCLILSAPKGMKVDHRDRNTLNNQRGNLRLATYQQNACNRPGDAGSSSRYKGVSWNKQYQCWRVSIGCSGKLHYLGSFHNEIEAAKTYDAAARHYHGEFAYLNFPDEAH